jgi:hypothetical protein
MDGRINVAEAPDFMVSRRPPNPVEKANPAWMLRPNSPLEITPHKAGVEGEAEILSATGALVAMFAEQGGPAALDGPHDLMLRPGDTGAAAFEETAGIDA